MPAETIHTVCNGQHHYYVAETVGVPAEGTASIIVVCTACGNSFSKKFSVSGPVPAFEMSQKTKEN